KQIQVRYVCVRQRTTGQSVACSADYTRWSALTKVLCLHPRGSPYGTHPVHLEWKVLFSFKIKKAIMSNKHLERVRRICTTFPDTTEKLSHGEPTFFVRKKVFAMFANNHHNDGHIAVWLPAPAGVQSMLIEGSPEKFFRPPYVGVRGWIGVELAN